MSEIASMFPMRLKRQPASPAEAARFVLEEDYAWIPDEMAERVAAAVLGWSDDTRFVARRIAREMWETMVGDQEQIWKHLHVQLAIEMFGQRCVPVSLPERTVTRMAGSPFDLQPARVVPDGWPWDMVELRLSVPVRKVA
jgi:hypothetical protein